MSGSLGKSAVTFGLALLGGIVGAVFGWIVTGFAADAILSVGGMSDINGGRAMVAFFTFAPFGAIAGLILGVWLVLRRRTGNRSFAHLAGYSALVVLLCAGVGAAYVGYLYLSDDVLVHNGPPPVLKFELRFPANATLPDKLDGVKIDLETDKNTMPGIFESVAKTDDGRTMAVGQRRGLFPQLAALRCAARARPAGPAIQAEPREQPPSLPRIWALAGSGFCRRRPKWRDSQGKGRRGL